MRWIHVMNMLSSDYNIKWSILAIKSMQWFWYVGEKVWKVMNTWNVVIEIALGVLFRQRKSRMTRQEKLCGMYRIISLYFKLFFSTTEGVSTVLLSSMCVWNLGTFKISPWWDIWSFETDLWWVTWTAFRGGWNFNNSITFHNRYFCFVFFFADNCTWLVQFAYLFLKEVKCAWGWPVWVLQLRFVGMC